MHRVDPSALVNENIDTEEEQEYGARMTEQRRQFIATDRARQEAVSAADAHALARMSESGTPGPTPSSTGTGNPAVKSKGKLGRKAGDNASGRDFHLFLFLCLVGCSCRLLSSGRRIYEDKQVQNARSPLTPSKATPTRRVPRSRTFRELIRASPQL